MTRLFLSPPRTLDHAQVSFSRLVATLDEHQHELRFVPAQDAAGDAGFVCGDRFLCCSRSAIASFAAAGFDVVLLPPGAQLDPRDVALFGSYAVFGHSARSNEAGFQALLAFAPQLKVLADVEVLADRLSSCVTFLDADTILYSSRGLSGDSVDCLRLAAKNLIEVSDRDARDHRVCSALVVDRHVYVEGCGVELRSQLEARGFVVHVVRTSPRRQVLRELTQ